MRNYQTVSGISQSLSESLEQSGVSAGEKDHVYR
jgi:hypothetical protein